MRDAAVSEGLPIGAFAAAAGVNVETVRYYQRKGLLSEPEKPYGSIRRYGEADVARVKFVKSAQRLGFTLDEVGVLLTLEDGMHCRQAQTLAQRKLTDVRSKLADLRRIESVLAQLVRECGQARGKVSCPLVTALQGR
jgi:MerR family transcriptional regulator, mercuric resistance operon regulatory protein